MTVQCRSCLSNTAIEYVDMVTSRVGQHTFLEFFHTIVQIQADSPNEFENLPKTLCIGCSQDLQVTYDFIESSKQAHNILIQGLRAVNTNNEKINIEAKSEEEHYPVEELILEEDETALKTDLMEFESVDQQEQEESKDENRYDGQEVPASNISINTSGEEHYVDEECQMNSIIENSELEDEDSNDVNITEYEEHEERLEQEIDDVELEEDPDIDDNIYLKEEESPNPDPNKWKCYECKRILSGDVSYEGHMNWHHGKSPYKCPDCSYSFRCKIVLERHVVNRHNKGENRRFVCEFCRKIFPVYYLLEEHKQKFHKDKSPKTCAKCDKSFEFLLALKEHLHLVHSNTLTLICPYCTSPKEIQRENIAEHFKEEHIPEYYKHFATQSDNISKDDLKWKCDICQLIFSTEFLLQKHRVVHVKGRRNQCPHCSKLFSYPSTLEQHIWKYHSDKKNANIKRLQQEKVNNQLLLETCTICNKQLAEKNMEKHMELHNKRKEKFSRDYERTKYICAYCSRECKNLKALTQHEKMHCGELFDIVHICNECDRQYATEQLLMHHVKQVHKERDNVCVLCGNAFKLKNQLINHMKLHLEKNIQCSLCDKKYARKFDLNVHMRTHTGEQPYACHLCDKKFAIKVRLTYHLQKHYGIKHPCKECGKQFNSKQKLKAHSYKHTGMPYRCEMCENHGFPNKNVFKRHLLKVHEVTLSNEVLANMFQQNTAKKYTTAYGLSLHEVNVHQETGEQFECPKCNKIFSIKRLFHLHMRNEHPEHHKCGICKKVYKTSEELYIHKESHDKTYHCHYCDNKFFRNVDLKMHLMSDHNRATYTCHLCTKTFSTRFGLNKHVEKHDSQKNICPICDESFLNKQLLRDHLFKHSGMPYRCEICPGIEYTRKRRFAHHMLFRHKRLMTDEELAEMFARNTELSINFDSDQDSDM